MESTNERKTALEQWLTSVVPSACDSIRPLQHDASFRRYFRITGPEGSFVAMDAPPPQEDCRPYVAIARALRRLNLKTPEIIAEDIDRGFLLLTDFGDTTYLKSLNPQNADQLYTRALQALSVLQACRDVPGRDIPPFTREFMHKEWQWHKEWFLNKWLHISPANENKLDECYFNVVEMAVRQPQVFMHRDYHSANLMVLPDDVGILDFQDAFIGPVTYDLVSLLRDCYIDWPDEKVAKWVDEYWYNLKDKGVLNNVSAAEFLQWFDWMGVQRHLKALLTFARKKVRDQQPQYLQHIPRTLNYLIQASSRYSELKVLHERLQTLVKPTVERELTQCVQ